ncbi:MAG: hypothetical protein QOJ63_1987, partial [Solirubrobacteraceae bacterium]|nr:hypothetical protein [Solirubrobacteraceae bacterium]
MADIETAPPAAPDAAEQGARQRLIVIGNGMAGARAVEEIIDRGGSDRFAIT